MSMAKTKAEIQRDYDRRTGYAAQTKYEAENVVRTTLKLNLRTDADILGKAVAFTSYVR